MAKDSEFSEKELAEGRKALEAERESSVLISRRQRLANALGMGGMIGPDPTGGNTTAVKGGK